MLNCAEPFDFRECDGYAEAVARENQIRGAACLGVNEAICGVEVKPLCPAHLGLLAFVGYPFHGGYTVEQLCGTAANKFMDGKPDLVTDIMRFLWIVSPQYQAGSRASTPSKRRRFESSNKYKARVEASKTARDRFNESFAPILSQPVDQVVREIIGYVHDSFIDCDENAPSTSKQYNALQISIAAELHEHYGYRIDFWSPECPPDKNPVFVPLKIIAQLRKYRAAKAGQPMLNKSDKLVADGLAKMAARDARLREYEAELSAETVKDIPPEARVNFDLN